MVDDDDMIKCKALTESLEHFRAMQNMHLWTVRSAKMISPYPTIMNLLLHFLKFWLPHAWIPSRETENKHIFNKHTSLFVTLFHLWILFGPVIFWNLNHPIFDVTHLKRGQSWARIHTVVRFRCPQHSWPKETRWGPPKVGVIRSVENPRICTKPQTKLKNWWFPIEISFCGYLFYLFSGAMFVFGEGVALVDSWSHFPKETLG